MHRLLSCRSAESVFAIDSDTPEQNWYNHYAYSPLLPWSLDIFYPLVSEHLSSLLSYFVLSSPLCR